LALAKVAQPFDLCQSLLHAQEAYFLTCSDSLNRVDSLCAESCVHLAKGYFLRGRFDSALYFYQQQERMLASQDLNQQQRCHLALSQGACYYRLLDLPQAVDFYTRALQLAEAPEDLRKIYHNLALAYLSQSRLEKAEELARRAMEMADLSKGSLDRIATLMLLGTISLNQERHTQAEQQYFEAYRLAKRYKQEHVRLRILQNLGYLRLNQGSCHEARSYLRQVFSQNKRMQDEFLELFYLRNLGRTHDCLGRPDSATYYFTLALERARASNQPQEEAKTLYYFHQFLARQGDPATAYQYQTNYVNVQDSLDSMLHDQRLLAAQSRFENQERSHELLQARSALQRAQLEQQRLWLGLILLVLLLALVMGGIIANRYRSTQRLNHELAAKNQHIQQQHQAIATQNQQLARMNEDLQQFVYVVSHHLREPLRTIGSYATLFDRRYHEQVDKDGQVFLNYIDQGVKNMKSLLDDLMHYTVISSTQHEMTLQSLDEVMKVVHRNLMPELQEAQVAFRAAPLPALTGNRSLLVLLFQHLIHNAIHFRQGPQPEVQVRVEQQDAQIEITVADNGQGIEPRLKDKIFSIFYQVNPLREPGSTGIGLAICRQVMHLHGGTIHAENNEQGGASFVMRFPQPARLPPTSPG